MRVVKFTRPVAKFRGLASLLLAMFVLTACFGGDKIIPIDAKTNDDSGAYPYDGLWNGQVKLVEQYGDCPFQRLGFQFEVDENIISAIVKMGPKFVPLAGAILEDGSLYKTIIPGRYSGEDISFAGKFEKDRAGGTWLTDECRGTWQGAKIK